MNYNLEHEILEPDCSEPGGRVTCQFVSLNSVRPPGFLLLVQQRNTAAFKPSYIRYLTAFCWCNDPHVLTVVRQVSTKVWDSEFPPVILVSDTQDKKTHRFCTQA
jgi:hypothetical protein